MIPEYTEEILCEILETIPDIQKDLVAIFDKKGPLNTNDRTIIRWCVYIWLPAFEDFVTSEYNRRKAQAE